MKLDGCTEEHPGCRVLVVEDNPIQQVVVSAMLRKLKIAFDLVETGEQAVAQWEQGDYELILMDVHLPGMSGIAATLDIRGKERQLRKGPNVVAIVAMTANATPGELQSYRDSGMNGYIGKPLEEAVLHRALQKWCLR